METKECYESLKNTSLVTGGGVGAYHETSENAKFMHAFTRTEWGARFDEAVATFCKQTFQRHHAVAKKTIWQYK